MQIADYFIVAVFYSTLHVFGIGLALTSWLERIRRVQQEQPVGGALLVAAVGLYWNSVVFIGLFLARIALSRWVLEVNLLADAAVIGVSLLLNRPALVRLWTAVLADGLTLAFLLGGALLGAWAMLEFPHVLDSGQIHWTQDVLDGGMRQPVSAMMGYSALVGPFGALFQASPVATTAAAFKPLLLGLFACLAVLVADVLAPRHRAMTALSFFLLSLLSTFGTYGLLELGKDSMWGLMFATAFFATLCREDAGRRGIELALYFTIAATLGVIALPYMVVAYGLWLLFSAPEDRAADTVPALVLVNLPVLPTVLAGFLNAKLGHLYIAYGILAVAVMACHRAGLIRRFFEALARPLHPIRAFIPVGFAIAAIVLFPVALDFPVWTNADGSIVTETRAPLDGQTSFVDYLFSLPAQNMIVLLGVLASLLISFTPFARRRPGFMALSAMPALVLSAALTRAHLRIHVINEFNIWDIVKDIPQYFGGTVFVLVLFGTLVSFSSIVRRAWIYPASLFVVTALCAVSAIRAIPLEYFMRPVTYEMFSGYSNEDMAIASDVAWKNLKGHNVWVDVKHNVLNQYFYSLQMYGVRPSFYDPTKIEEAISADPDNTGFIVVNNDIPSIRKAVSAKNGSIEFLASLSNGEASMLSVKMNGKSSIDLPRSLDAVYVSDGHYDLEHAGPWQFYWMRADAKINAVAPNLKTSCISIAMFDLGILKGEHIVTMTDNQGGSQSVDIAGHTPDRPAIISRTLNLGDETADLKLTDTRGEVIPPGDARKIAFGLLMPVRLDRRACTGEEERTTPKP